jgi:flagellar hook-length control protein FliK
MIIRLHKDEATRTIGSIPSFDGDFIEESEQSLQQEFSDLIDRATTQFSSNNQSDNTTLALAAASVALPTAQRPVEAPKREARAVASEGDSALQGAPALAQAQGKVDRHETGIAPDKGEQRSEQPAAQSGTAVETKSVSVESAKDETSVPAAGTEDQATNVSSVPSQASQTAEATEEIEGVLEQVAVAAVVPQARGSDKEDSVALEEAAVAPEVGPVVAPVQAATELTAKAPEKVDSKLDVDSVHKGSLQGTGAVAETVTAAPPQLEAPVASESPATIEVVESASTRAVQRQTELPQVERAPEVPGADQLQATAAPVVDLQALSRRPDAAVQMSLLRQAFEGIKSSTADLKAGITGIQTPNVSGISAPSGARSSQGEASQKSVPKQPLTRLAALRTLERVDTALREAARSRDGKTLSFRLDPPQLGQVKVDVTMREGGLHARLTPENQQVTVLVREHAHELQASLRKLGLNVETVTVSVGTEWANSSAEGGEFASDGKSFQQDRNKLPGEGGQVAETTLGNELALTNSSALGGDNDHWVA